MPARSHRRPFASSEIGHTSDWWSAPFGVWLGAPLRLHLTLVVVVAITASYAIESSSFQIALALVVYLGSLLAHELAHAAAVWNVGGVLDRIVLGPAGGFARHQTPSDPAARVFVAMAGPMANLAILVVATCLLAMHNEPRFLELFVPGADSFLAKAEADTGRPILLLARLAVLVNWPLFVLNMLPSFPFDGGDVLRSLLWPWLGQRSSAVVTGRLGYLLGGLCILAGPVLLDTDTTSLASALLMTLGIVICFGSHRDLYRAHHDSESESQLIQSTMLDNQNSGFEDFWLDDRDDQMVLVELKQEIADQAVIPAPHRKQDGSFDEQRLDEILAKLHKSGIHTLTDEERDLLDFASQCYRDRRQTD